MLADLKAQYDRIPKAVKVFAFRGVVLILLWNIVYKLLLEPSGVPDVAMCHFFCNITAKSMSVFYPGCFVRDVTVFVNNRPVINIFPACNGLDLLVIYVGFIMCLPTNGKRMLKYILWGSIAICVINYLRFVAISYMVLQRMTITGFAHHYIFTLIVYGFIFLLWRQYSKGYGWK